MGRGCIAGPLCVVVIAFPKDHPPIKGVADSKKLSKKVRESLAPLILQQASFFGIGWVSPSFIDANGMTHSWHCAARQALFGGPEMELVVDGVDLVEGYEGIQKAEPKADDKYWEVSAASIVAKVLRDNEMKEAGAHYPGYGFEKHSGYGTKAHNDFVLKNGPCPQHRMLFLRKMIQKHQPYWQLQTFPSSF